MDDKKNRYDLSTAEGQAKAVRAYRKRQAAGLTNIRMDNTTLPASSPMYYYCTTCGCMAAMLPETFVCGIPQYCPPCWQLHSEGVIQGPSYALTQRDKCEELMPSDNGSYYTCPYIARCKKCTAIPPKK